ncbi:hypothetical protein OROHE_022522 [Orobanche hederae]
MIGEVEIKSLGACFLVDCPPYISNVTGNICKVQWCQNLPAGKDASENRQWMTLPCKKTALKSDTNSMNLIFKAYLCIRHNEISAQITPSYSVHIPHPTNHDLNGSGDIHLEFIQK